MVAAAGVVVWLTVMVGVDILSSTKSGECGVWLMVPEVVLWLTVVVEGVVVVLTVAVLEVKGRSTQNLVKWS